MGVGGWLAVVVGGETVSDARESMYEYVSECEPLPPCMPLDRP
jgi:hypothetical protein